MATRFPASQVLTLVTMVAVIQGCVTGQPFSAPAMSPESSGAAAPGVAVAVAADGLCVALAALPDTVSAERAFVNLAHDALHTLAADARLDRARSARVLEAMVQVETDLRTTTAERVLASDLSTLYGAAADALGALGIAGQTCTS